MKKYFLLIIVLLICAVTVNAQGKKEYGAKLTLKKLTAISKIVSNPNEFIGKRVQVEGTVVGVCEKRGCWIEVADANDQKIRVKVEDGEIVFPMETKGKTAKVEGILYSIKIPKDSEAMEAEHKKQHKDDEDCKEHDSSGNRVVYMLKGLGAEIK